MTSTAFPADPVDAGLASIAAAANTYDPVDAALAAHASAEVPDRPTMPDGRLLGESRKGVGDYNPSIADGDRHILADLSTGADQSKDTWLGSVVGQALTGMAKFGSGLFTAATGSGRADTGGSWLHEIAADLRAGAARVPDYQGGNNPGPLGLPTPNQFMSFPTNPLAWPGDAGRGAAALSRFAGASPQTSEDIGTITQNAAPALVPFALREFGPEAAPESAVDADTGPEGEVSLEPPTKAHGPSVSDQILADSRKAGYVVPPATTNPSIVNRVVEGFAGKASVAQAAAIKNQPITDGLARSALGLPPDAELTPETMDAVRAPAGQVYAQVAGSGRISIDPQYQADLSKITEASNTIKGDLPNYSSGAQDEIQNLVKSIVPENGTMDATTAVALSKDLRKNANANYNMAARTGDSTRTDIARAQQAAAGAVEDQVERHLTAQGQPDLATDWDNARTTIAKSYTVQNALDGAGHVDATKLGKQLLKGKPLSDELETAANFANAFPKAARVAPGKESMPGMSPLDVYGSVAASLGTGSPLPMLLGPGRMAARSMALSKPFQPSE
jgi:hypothetical protein